MDLTAEDFRTSLQQVLISPEILDQLSHVLQGSANPGQSPMTTPPVLRRLTDNSDKVLIHPPLRDPEASGPSVSSHREDSSPSLREDTRTLTCLASRLIH